jgi:hypothetical protein
MKKIFLLLMPMTFLFTAYAQKVVIKGDFQYEQPVKKVFPELPVGRQNDH